MNVLDYIGKTPLIKLRHLPDGYADVYVKLESANPGGSIKTRVAAKMIENAEKRRLISPGDTIIEATGGNTGIGLAIVCNVKGYNLLAVVPDNYSKERIKKLKIYGAEVRLSDSRMGNDSHIKLVQQLLEEHPEYVWLNQFENTSSVSAHFEGTGPEIYEQIQPDAFVSCIGSAGSFQGIGSFFKTKREDTLLFAVQPKGCNLKKGKAVPHKIQGVSLGIIPLLLDYKIISGYIDVEFEEVIDLLLHLIRKEGLFLGISSGANILGALNVAEKLGQGKIVCTIAPDGGDNYMDEFVEKQED